MYSNVVYGGWIGPPINLAIFVTVLSLQARLRGAEDRLREKEAELGECGRQRDAERQRARELEEQIRRLQPLIQDRDREIQVRVCVRVCMHVCLHQDCNCST